MKAASSPGLLIAVALLASITGSSLAQSVAPPPPVQSVTVAQAEVPQPAEVIAEPSSAQNAPAQAPVSSPRRKHGRLVAVAIVGGLLLFVVLAAVSLRHS